MTEPFTENSLELDFLAVAALGVLEVEDTDANKVEALQEIVIPNKD